MIVLSRPQIGPEEIAAVTEVLESGMLASGKRRVCCFDRSGFYSKRK